MIILSTPYSVWYSKNKSHRHNRRGFKYIVHEARGILDDLALELRNAKGTEVFDIRKVWVKIMVIKPSRRGDAINFVDNICDVVKKVIGVDDSWFSVIVDWEINKEKPKIIIEVWQDEKVNS